MRESRWFTDIRKAALITFVTSVASLLPASWAPITSIIALESEHPESKIWMTPMMISGFLLVVTLPVFYFALSCNEEPIRIPRRLRRYALVGIFSLGIFVLSTLPEFARFFRGYWSLSSRLFGGGTPSGWEAAKLVLAELSNLTSTLLLIVLFSQANDEPRSVVRVSRFLSIATMAAVMGFGLQVAIHTIRILATPFAHRSLLDWAQQAGVRPPSVADFGREILPALLSSFGLFTAPYIVWRSLAAGASRDQPIAETIITPT